MNRRGEILIRDIFFIMIIFTGIILAASIFVGEMATEYENENMSDEFIGSILYSQSNSSFDTTFNNLTTIGDGLDDSNNGLLDIITEGGTAIKLVISTVVGFPTSLGNMIESVLQELKVDQTEDKQLSKIIGDIVTILIWAIIIFTIISAFLSGGKI